MGDARLSSSQVPIEPVNLWSRRILRPVLKFSQDLYTGVTKAPVRPTVFCSVASVVRSTLGGFETFYRIYSTTLLSTVILSHRQTYGDSSHPTPRPKICVSITIRRTSLNNYTCKNRSIRASICLIFSLICSVFPKVPSPVSICD